MNALRELLADWADDARRNPAEARRCALAALALALLGAAWLWLVW